MPEQDIFENEVEVVADIPQTAEVKQYTGSISIGDVVTLSPGTDATVTNTGTSENAIFNFGIPRGAAGTSWGSVVGDINDQTDLMAIISALQSRIVSLENSLPEVGSIATSVKSSLSGHLLCNGQAVSRVTYAALFAVIGTGFGPGDGTSTFNVPDYRGCFLRGLGGNSNSSMYIKQEYQNSDHYHLFGTNYRSNNGQFVNLNGLASANLPNLPSAGYCEWNGDGGGGGYIGDLITFTGNMITTVQNEIAAKSSSKTSQETRPTNFAINFFIKY